jgi:hypothetical protein
MSTLTTSAPHQPTIDPRRCTLAPHRKHAKKFLTLPDELLTNITDHVSPKDLPNFRLTCKTLANIAAKQFGQKRLAHRRFIFTKYSLQGLIDMTGHSVFGPCIKSIMFGTDRPTNELQDLLGSLKKHKITDHTKAMHVLQTYHERWIKHSAFLKSSDLSRMLVTALTNLSTIGINVSLGIFDNDREKRYYNEVLTYGYGFSIEYDDLPFAKFLTLNRFTLGIIQQACAGANFTPEFFGCDLSGQERHEGTEPALSNLLLMDGEFHSSFDVCLRVGWTNIRISTRRNLLGFKQRSTSPAELTSPEHIRLGLRWLGSPLLDAFIAASITHFCMESCSMWCSNFVDVFQHLDETLQVVELVNVTIWGDDKYVNTLFPVLHCIRDDLDLQRLVMDNVRATSKNLDDGLTVVTERCWNGQRQIQAGIDALTGFDEKGLDGDELFTYYEKDVRDFKLHLQSMDYSDYEHRMDYAEFLRHKENTEWNLEEHQRQYDEYRVPRIKAKEAMARVESGEYNT